MSAPIEISGLRKSFGTTVALDGLDLTVAQGEIHGFLGPNGAGKSTTIRVLLGLLRADGGQARLLGADFTPYKHPVHAGFQRCMYLTADGRYLQFSMVRTAEEFDACIIVLEALELLADDRFLSPELRYANGMAFIAALRPFVQRRTAAEWMDLFREAGVPVALVARVDDLSTDPQILANNMLMQPPPAFGGGPIIDHPLNIDGLARAPLQPPPALGEHSREILTSLGYDGATIDRLVATGVV